MSERITTANDRYAYEIGADYALAGSITQAALLNGLAAGLSKVTSRFRDDLQLCFIERDLTPSARQLVIELAEFAKLEEGQ
ncbi:hypothetical protein [Brevibacterium sp. CFH 10365]|uniref:hypothetical protein n=1 Tax=Brevibacterium sp. CFH 10365 TaxID=2585207 RepID=UPI0012661DF0|nr:hypothetical protein [Brevibacterium sp. CFH 10365]